MKFETLLARRYISTQNRHSLLTVCSIIIAVALITMLCSCYTTMQGIRRASAFDAQPYHVMFYSVTKNQAAAIKHVNQVESVELIDNHDGTYQAQVLFGEYIDNHWTFLENMVKELRLNAVVDYPGTVEGIDVNLQLMELDLINLDGRYAMTQNIALLFIFLVFFVLALRLVIDTMFEVSSKERERQFGVLQSVGATPKQIVRILTAEGMMLSAAGVPLGVGLGLLLGFIAFKAVLASGVAEVFFTTEKAAKLIQFHINPWITLGGAVVGICWVFFSAYGTGTRIIKMSPVQAISMRSNTVKKVKKHTMLSLIFGWKGKLASRNACRQPKRFIITVLSLTVSLTMFATVSTIIKEVETVYTDAMLMHDEFGAPQMFDFTFELGENINDGLCDPLSYKEGVDLLRSQKEYFEEPDYNIPVIGNLAEDDPLFNENAGTLTIIYYVSRATYQRIFGDNPEMTYDELTNAGGAILLNTDESVVPADTEDLRVRCRRYSALTQEEYEARKKEYDENPELTEKESVFQGEIWEHGVLKENYWYKVDWQHETFHIVKHYDNDRKEMRDQSVINLLFTEDTYRSGDWKKYGEVRLGGPWVNVNLTDESKYNAAKSFLFAHGDTFGFHEDDPDLMLKDCYGEMRRIRTMLSAVNIALIFFLGMIALIAIVNMVNIVSTGILNRRHELAAMQCVGMTHGQMYGMTVIECLQFTLWAAIAASLLCILLIVGTQMYLNSVQLTEQAEGLMPFGDPILRVWAASIVAFLCALLASVIPLHRMQKEELVEQIRSVE